MPAWFDLKGKVVLVAGGAGYLALPACQALAQHGAAVVIADIKPDRLETAVKVVGDENPGAIVSALPLDVADESSIRDVVRNTVVRHGRLDAMVNATFFSIGKKVEELSGAEFDKANHINLTGSFLLAREAVAAMPAGGSVVMFASMYGIVAPDPRIYHPPMNPNPVEYGAGKAGILQMTRYLAGYYGPKGIRVNSIAPGPFPWASQQEADPAFTERLAGRTMLGRIGRRDEMAGAVVFLVSDASSYVTGHCLQVDGGWTQW